MSHWSNRGPLVFSQGERRGSRAAGVGRVDRVLLIASSTSCRCTAQHQLDRSPKQEHLVHTSHDRRTLTACIPPRMPLAALPVSAAAITLVIGGQYTH